MKYAIPLDARLDDRLARNYSARIERAARVRASVFHIGMGVSAVELRPLPGKTWWPTRTLRTAADCEQLLAQLEQAT